VSGAVDGAVTFEFIEFDDVVRLGPVDEVFCDFLAAGMLADLAFPLVIFARGRVGLGEKASDGAAAGRWFRLRFGLGRSARRSTDWAGRWCGGALGGGIR